MRSAGHVRARVAERGGATSQGRSLSSPRRSADELLRRTVGNRAVERAVGGSRSTDVLESAADRLAREVVRDVIGSGGHRRRSRPGRARSAAVALEGAARRVPASVRALVEPRLGVDLADVRVHRDGAAAAAAGRLHARAFTSGRDVWLGRGESEHDVALMAHELTHVAQQASGRTGHEAPAGAAPQVQLLPFGITLPTGVRGLDAAEVRIGRGVFAGSLHYGDVYVSDGLGGGGRPFTLYVPAVGTVLQLGTSAYRTPGSDPDLLVHELTHSWQSQHHPDPTAYIGNSLASQALASAAGGGASPYCYVPGKPFGSYAAEQIAQQVERGEPAIRTHVASVGAGAWDGANIASLSLPRWETRGAPGVRC